MARPEELFGELLLLVEKTDPRWINTKLWIAHCYEGLGNLRMAQNGYEAVFAFEKSTELEIRIASEGLQRLNVSTGRKYQ